MNAPPDNLPDFLIIGAPKSGSTSLYNYLALHPEIFMSRVKEPRYFVSPDRRPPYRGAEGRRFNRDIMWRLDEYRRLFADRGGARAAGEASVTYLWAPQTPAAIRRLIPAVRMIAILRNPADRAYSHFCHNRRQGREPLADFRAALDAEEARITDGCGPNLRYRERGRYGEQVARYRSIFPAEQLRVYLSEDLTTRPAAMLAEICRFLGVDDCFVFDTSVRHNVTEGLPRRVWLNRLFVSQADWKQAARRFVPASVRTALFERLYRPNLGPVPVLDSDLRRTLMAGFRDDLRLLEGLIGRDLGHWLG